MAQPEPGAPAAHSLALKLFTLVELLSVLPLVLAVSILRSLNRFCEAAYEIALGRVGDNALVIRNGVREPHMLSSPSSSPTDFPLISTADQ